MSISGVANSTSTDTSSSASQTSLSSLTSNYDTFLTLLTSQLKNQDPLQPTDTAEFTKQLVQYSQVEQQIQSNQKLDNILGAINNNEINQSLSYLGKTVEVQSNGVSLQDGKAHMTVTTDAPASTSVMEITDGKTGKLIRTLSLTKTAGTQEVNWDGLDDNGAAVKDGAYKVAVKAKDAADKDVNAMVMSFGRVTGVDLTAGEPYLALGEMYITPDNILSVTS
jgi:flagellar basal-body rod modification protein FlgD